jgi:hypothetical protein
VAVPTLRGPQQATQEERGHRGRARRPNELELRPIRSTVRVRGLRCKPPELVRKGIRAHVPGCHLIRAVLAQAAATHGTGPRPLRFKGTRQTLGAVPPLLGDRTAQAPAPRFGLDQERLAAVAPRCGADRPDRFAPRARTRRRNHSAWLLKPRAGIKRKMAKGVTENYVSFGDGTDAPKPAWRHSILTLN